MIIALPDPLIFSGCSVLDPTPSSMVIYSAMNVEEVAVPDTISLNLTLPITVRGLLPDPSWEFNRFELIDERDQLTILPIGKQDLQVDASCQDRVPFTTSTSFRPKRSGRLKVVVQGKTLETEVIVVAHGSNRGEENALIGTKSALHP